MDPILALIDDRLRALEAQRRALEAANPKVIIGPISNEQRIAAIEALLARQHAGSPEPGDAEKIRAIERLLERRRREAAPGRAASVPVAPPVHPEPAPEPVSEAPSRVVGRTHRGVSYQAIGHGPEPELKPGYIDSPRTSSAGRWSASQLWPPPVPQQLQIPSHKFEDAGRRRPRWPLVSRRITLTLPRTTALTAPA